MNGEQIHAPTPEKVYESMSGIELVKGYLSDEIPGQAVMGRLLDEIDLTDVAKEPLPIKMDGKDINIEDYLEVARHHGQALPSILKFVALKEKDENMREAMRRTILGYLGQ